MSNGQDLVYFNGIDSETGVYDLPPQPAEELVPFIEETGRPDNFAELQWRSDQRTSSYLGVQSGIDPTRLDEAGWGVIFAEDADPAVLEALDPLLELRQQQARSTFKVFQGPEGYQLGLSKNDFLGRNSVGAGPADPRRVPYYLLIAGSPEAIPYQFESRLSVQYAVGRIHFPTPEGYANYARTVVKAEKGAFDIPALATFFSVTHPYDPVTDLGNKFLIEPLLKDVQSARLGMWQFQELLGGAATKEHLALLLGEQPKPALLFTAGHGLSFHPYHPQKQRDQGALLCADWPGLQHEAGPDSYFGAADLDPGTNLQGMMAFFTSSYGIGVPATDFAQHSAAGPAFVSALPQAMLSLEEGGALAVIGQVGRAPAFSPQTSQTTIFSSVLRRLLNGDPVGYALEYFNEQYAELFVQLSDQLEEMAFGMKANPEWLAGMWTTGQYAHNFKIFGDPAARLPFERSWQAW